MGLSFKPLIEIVGKLILSIMKTLSLKNLKGQALNSAEMKNIKGAVGSFCYPDYYCGAYYCANVNPNACCCP